MNVSRAYKLPNNEVTYDVNVYSNEWAKLYEPFCKYTDTIVIGFNPGVLFSDGFKVFDMPVSILKKLNKVFEQLDKKTKNGKKNSK